MAAMNFGLRKSKALQAALLAPLAIAGACAATPGGSTAGTSVSVPQRAVREPVVQAGRQEGAGDCTRVLWCASGGAALVGEPVLDDLERVYVATSDGYLHAFERDGRFRFSYTVEGTPLGSVSLRPGDGAILLGTSAGQIYAINQNGSLHFRHRTPTAVWSGLYALNERSVTFLGLDWRLYALGNSGQALYRVRAPSAPTTEPVVGARDVVWVGLDGAVARFVAAYRLERIPLENAGKSLGPVEQIVTLGSGAVARASSHAYWMTSGRVALDLGAAEQMGSDGDLLAMVASQRLRVLAFDEPTTVRSQLESAGPVEIGAQSLDDVAISGALAVRGSHIVAPRSDGKVSVHDVEGDVCKGEVADAPLRQPVLGRSGKYFVVADYSGQFCAVELRAAVGSLTVPD